MAHGTEAVRHSSRQQQQERQQRQVVVGALYLLMNVVSSVGLIMCNKAILSRFHFGFATCLTGLHFTATAIAGVLWSSNSSKPSASSPPHSSTTTSAISSSTCSSSTGESPSGASSIDRGTGKSTSMNTGTVQQDPARPASAGDAKDAAARHHGKGAEAAAAGAALWVELVWFSVIANVSIVGMNLSLMLNSIGLYQISKLCVLPAVSLIESLVLGKRFSPPVIGAVAIVTLGVGVCTVTDFGVNALGALVALVAVLSTAMQQVLIGVLQRKHGLSSFELLSRTSPLQAASLLVLGPLCDRLLTGHDLFAYPLTTLATAFIALSCMLAISCNLSQYLCLGRFSATTFQVLGNLKTVLVLLTGWWLYGAHLSLGNMAGIAIALFGMGLYSTLVHREKSRAATLSAASTGKVKEL